MKLISADFHYSKSSKNAYRQKSQDLSDLSRIRSPWPRLYPQEFLAHLTGRREGISLRSCRPTRSWLLYLSLLFFRLVFTRNQDEASLSPTHRLTNPPRWIRQFFHRPDVQKINPLGKCRRIPRGWPWDHRASGFSTYLRLALSLERVLPTLQIIRKEIMPTLYAKPSEFRRTILSPLVKDLFQTISAGCFPSCPSPPLFSLSPHNG